MISKITAMLIMTRERRTVRLGRGLYLSWM